MDSSPNTICSVFLVDGLDYDDALSMRYNVIYDSSFSRNMEKIITVSSTAVALLYSINQMDWPQEGESGLRWGMEGFAIIFSIFGSSAGLLNRQRTAHRIKGFVNPRRGKPFILMTTVEKLTKFLPSLSQYHQLENRSLNYLRKGVHGYRFTPK